MGVAAGIIGLPNVGKSTIFNALCTAKASAENYPFCTIEPNIGVVAVPDDRLERLTSIVETQKIVPAFLELVDVAGLVKDAAKGEGLGNQFLGHIRNVSALVHVVRCFRDSNVVHVDGSIDALRDVETIKTELLLKDLDTVENAIAKKSKAAKSGDKNLRSDVEILKKAREALSKGLTIRAAFADSDSVAALYNLRLLTAKKMLYVANVDEEGLGEESESVQTLARHAREEDSEMIKICGKIEAEVAELEPEEQREFLQSMGLKQPGLQTLTRSIYRVLGLKTFFTSTPKESRAWTIRSGATAVEAAGQIHTDMQRGFICAEVFRLEQLEKAGSEHALRAEGKIRQEGKEYVVQDGDIIFFRFNV